MIYHLTKMSLTLYFSCVVYRYLTLLSKWMFLSILVCSTESFQLLCFSTVVMNCKLVNLSFPTFKINNVDEPHKYLPQNIGMTIESDAKVNYKFTKINISGHNRLTHFIFVCWKLAVSSVNFGELLVVHKMT